MKDKSFKYSDMFLSYKVMEHGMGQTCSTYADKMTLIAKRQWNSSLGNLILDGRIMLK